MSSKRIIFSFILLLLTACGGGTSGGGMLVLGTLTEGGGTDHSRTIQFKHGAGDRIENVQLCALGECSTTDAEGQWGFEMGSDFAGGDVAFTILGHGIDTTSLVNIPSGAEEVIIDFQHVENGAVQASHVTVDGETVHNEVGDDMHHQEDHSHE